ncbi:DNA repair protein rad16, partial [Tulasnella sp. 427]
MPRTRARAASVNSDDLDGETPTTASSAKTSSRGRTSTAKSTPATSNAPDSEEEDDEEAVKPAKRVTRSASSMAPQVVAKKGRAASKAATSTKKRSRPSTEDEQDEEDEEENDDQASLAGSKTDTTDNCNERASKRRVVSSSFYIEIPMRRSSSQLDVKGEGKAKDIPEPRSATSSTKTSPASRASSRYTAKSGGRKPRTSEASSTTDYVSDASGLEYDEHLDESTSSASTSGDEGSVFEAKDDEDEEVVLMGPTGDSSDKDDFEEVVTPSKGKGKGQAKAKTSAKRRRASPTADDDESDEQDIPLAHVMAVDDEDEANMLRMAMDASLNDRRARAAAAAESRASRAVATRSSGLPLVDVDDSVMDEDSDLSEGEESEDGGGFVTKKGAKKAKQTVKSKKPKKETKAERRRREAMERNPGAVYLKQEKQRLGRNLTHAERTNVLLRVHHPELRDVWGDLERAVKPATPEKAEQPKDLKANLLPFQQESLFWMRKQERGIWKGGCLADEMGMGKTIQTLALLSSDRTKPNLIVAPTVAIMQWKNEIDLHTQGFKVVIYHGQARTKDSDELGKADVVLTTYAVLESVFRKQHSGFTRKGVIMKEKSILHQLHWRRIVLDEAHNIKERSCNTAKAAFELKSDFKWCLSGTPLQNRVGELYSLV